MELHLLNELIAQIPLQLLNTPEWAGVRVSGIVLDSRAVKPGDIFVALSGGSTDGHRYISSAVQNGAAAVVGTQPMDGLPVPYLQVADGRLALAQLAAALNGFPARKLIMIGVTGTDGKTTTCNLIYQILKAAGIRAGLVSTINAVIGEQVLDTGFHVTTPEAPDVQQYLKQMVDSGLTHAVLETTSHGLDQQRVGACEFDLAAVTNITHEHLDYHGSYEGYRAAKARLFTGLAETQPKLRGVPHLAVLNRDDQSYEYLSSVTTVPQLSYSLKRQGADLWADDIRFDPDGLRFTAHVREMSIPIFSRFVGEFNVSNILAALGITLVGLGIDPQAAQAGIAALESVPGRMERIDLGQNFTAVVDFAHTPNALKVALEAVRRMTSGRVLAVFGSAGLRDREKRRMMAEVSAQMADLTYLTAEDPRTESLDEILAEMADAASARGGVEGRTFWRIPDRGEAIRRAVQAARPGDLVIACGKGHEQSMCFGTTEYAWDDRTAMRAALAELLGRPGPAMPYLPTQEK